MHDACRTVSTLFGLFQVLKGPGAWAPAARTPCTLTPPLAEAEQGASCWYPHCWCQIHPPYRKSAKETRGNGAHLCRGGSAGRTRAWREILQHLLSGVLSMVSRLGGGHKSVAEVGGYVPVEMVGLDLSPSRDPCEKAVRNDKSTEELARSTRGALQRHGDHPGADMLQATGVGPWGGGVQQILRL